MRLESWTKLFLSTTVLTSLTVTAVLALYLNVFVLIMQLFLKAPSLRALAPTQSEPPFQVTQLAALVLFLVLGTAAVRWYRPAPSPSARNFG